MLVSSFSGNPLAHGSVYVVPDIVDAVKTENIKGLKEQKLKTGFTLKWPNDVRVVPQGVFGDTRAIVIPDGFLVPGHVDGGIYINTIDDNDITKVTGSYTMTHNTDGFFYHMGTWVDMNQDGRKDFVTAKSNDKPNEGGLVWYEQPEGGLVDTWTEHLVTLGPDVGILIDETAYSDSIVVYAAEFFAEKLCVYRVSTKDGSLMDSLIIDDEILSAYSI